MTQAHQDSNSAVAKQDSQGKQMQSSRAGARDVEIQENCKSASASAGLNLNLFAALSGAFTSSSKKSTTQNPNGSSETTREKFDRGAASAAAHGNASAYGAASAHDHSRKSSAKGVSAEQIAAREIKANSSKSARVDHLGIEG